MLTPRYYFCDDFKKYEELFLSKQYKTIKFKKGQCLSGSEDNFNKIYYIVDGMLKLSIIHESGNEKCISFHGKGNLQPYYYPLDFKLEKSLMLTAVTDGIALEFDKEYFHKIIRENVDIYDTLLEGFVKLVNLLMCDTTNLLYNNGLIKICNFLNSYLKIGESKGNIIPIRQDELAAIVGMNRANTAKHLRELRERNIIKTSRNKIIIIDEKQLYKLCSDEYIEK